MVLQGQLASKLDLAQFSAGHPVLSSWARGSLSHLARSNPMSSFTDRL
jgi:hypothetical protein